MMGTPSNRASRRLLAGLLASLALPLMVRAQLNRGLPPELDDIGIREQLDGQLPLDRGFIDDQGRRVRLGDYFDGVRPVILTLNYYRCPMLCDVMLNGMIDALKEINLEPGREFEIVTLSFDPLEKHQAAKAKKQSYVEAYGKPGAVRGWHFLVGEKDDIKAVTGAVGFVYRWNEDRGEWAHPAAMILCTPKGRISRYLGGVMFDPQTVRLSLVEASAGKIGTLWDQVWLTCFHYVSGDGKYVPHVLGIMRLGGALTVLILGTTMATLFAREARRRRRPPGAAPPVEPASAAAH